MPQLLASRQEALAQQTAQLEKQVGLIGEHVAELMPGKAGQQLAQAAARALQQAGSSQRGAARAVGSGRFGKAIPSQQAGARALGQAASALGQLGQQFAARAGRIPPVQREGKDQSPDELAQAYQAAQAAAQNQSYDEAALAARLLSALAARAGQMARGMGLRPGMRWGRGWANTRFGAPRNSNARVGWGITDLRAEQLRELGIAPDDWARLPGKLKDEILQVARTGGPQEYRELVRLYFRALAERAAEGSGRTGGAGK